MSDDFVKHYFGEHSVDALREGVDGLRNDAFFFCGRILHCGRCNKSLADNADEFGTVFGAWLWENGGGAVAYSMCNECAEQMAKDPAKTTDAVAENLLKVPQITAAFKKKAHLPDASPEKLAICSGVVTQM